MIGSAIFEVVYRNKGNKHYEAEGFISQHVGSRWDTSDIHVVTSD
jgi:hypothetical protein